jgi:hypothetical protein
MEQNRWTEQHEHREIPTLRNPADSVSGKGGRYRAYPDSCADRSVAAAVRLSQYQRPHSCYEYIADTNSNLRLPEGEHQDRRKWYPV